ncbi:hypothetical protein [Pseudosulfitobacter pseudonitzschiae]|uniref:hypothetical protein n=1 Tax=Pseudosulfitobacter pseudonitzschiae TaxID=1402135 RepID=UPI003B7645C4
MKKYLKSLSTEDKGQFLFALSFCFLFTGLALTIWNPLPLIIWVCFGLMVLADYLAKKPDGEDK